MSDLNNEMQRKVLAASYAVEAARKFVIEDGKPTLTEQKILDNDNTMVTVVCITYNHEDYIAQALDSFLMQKTDFKFKVFVGEDCGPDRTADIVREYAEKYPDIIVPFIRKENMGAQRNLIDMCQRATSPYIAFCEGDDYWIDEYKLQKQVDYMDRNPDMRFCFHNIEIVAPDDWYFNNFYKPNAEGRRLMPDCIPGYNKSQKTFDARSYIRHNPARTSSIFYRWNYDADIPAWYYQHLGGDVSMAMIQLGDGQCAIIPGVMATWRRSEVGVTFAADADMDFLKTRIDWVSVLSDLRQYFIDNYNGFAKIQIENRIKLESANYLQTLIKLNKLDLIADFFESLPKAGSIALNAYLCFYRDSRALTAVYGWDGYQMAVRNRYFRRLVKPLVRLALMNKKKKDFLKGKIKKKKDFLKGKIKNIISFIYYWRYTFTAKQKTLWAFSSFFKRGYIDNVKYLYEYVLEHHPEIQAVWMTLDKNVYERLHAENKPVVMMRTAECRNILSHAEVAFTDHYRMSDYDAFSGLNDRTKVVQLWHGVGLKSMTKIIEDSTIVGLQFSDDILLNKQESFTSRVVKTIRYFRHAYYRELFERYFMLVCPGPERIAQIAKPLHIPIEKCFMSGHPRNILLHQTSPDADTAHILYAPTYRWNASKERQLVQQVIDSANMIQDFMSKTNGYLTIRLHPHTWRNYNSLLNTLVQQYDRILLDSDKDIYQTLGKYRILISDYSSIAYDFVLLNRPIVFFNYDFLDFKENECALNYDYDTYSPGTKTQTWEQTLAAIESYLIDPEKDSEWRCQVRDEFYDMSVNDENNSKRIVEELKKRLEIL